MECGKASEREGCKECQKRKINPTCHPTPTPHPINDNFKPLKIVCTPLPNGTIDSPFEYF